MTSLLTSPPARTTFEGGRCLPSEGGFELLWETQDAEQDLVNRAAVTCSPDLVRRLIVRLADRRHAEFPQYAGHWNGWTLGRARRTVVTKGGRRFVGGDVVLVEPAAQRTAISMYAEKTAYSVRGAVDCSVGYDVERI